MKQNPNVMGLLGLGIFTFLVGCGDDQASLSQRADSAADSIAKTAGDVKDAIVGETEETREEAEARFANEEADLKKKIAELEAKIENETVREVRTAERARLKKLNESLAKAEKDIQSFLDSGSAQWKGKREAASASLEDARDRASSELDRLELKEDIRSKLESLESKIDSIEEEAKKASPARKRVLDNRRAELEKAHKDLEKESYLFQISVKEEWDDFQDWFSEYFESLSDSVKELF
ncbi:MAG: hypothetical protein EA369_06180 [Bradymonadales bacterium]|nr:MAG: hypothetical protein EA369_06180 [Bradymonadales bacterium]